LAIFNVKESRQSQGWDDIMTLPTHLSLCDDNSMSIRPVDEIESLRGDRTTASNVEVDAGQQVVLDSIEGNAIEISITIAPGDAQEVGLNVLQSPDAEETTRISFFPKGHPRWGSAHLQIDGSSSSIRTDLISRPPELAPFDVSEGEPINLRIFVDRSIIEVFANDRQCLTLRAYPDRHDSVGVSLFSNGGTAKFTGIESWQMECTWPELR